MHFSFHSHGIFCSEIGVISAPHAPGLGALLPLSALEAWPLCHSSRDFFLIPAVGGHDFFALKKRDH